ncbi:hypothetical protein [Luteipulveratus flavus]|uniref:SCP domain-containing protein n=1 Tax=Luteipulveratus flavus TaxID=3031728 RepID=A0ABT6C513_9MICO|nr:hypothetical protein [Luteipulveratus sp. YIM 133296]MDF8263796.1 hypothetical protein [Luteipulveratus sp. YIM 133296]
MSGRHAASGSGRRWLVPALLTIAVLLLAVGAAAGLGLWDGDDSSGQGAPTTISPPASTSAVVPSSSAGASPTAGTSSTTIPSPGAATSSTSGPSPVAAIDACRGEVGAGTALARAAASSAAHYGTHTQAQLAVDAGRISEATAKQRWADSKKLGPSDVSAFAAADRTYTSRSGACGRVPTGTAGANGCRSRASALADLARTARPINSGWSHHLDMMKSKPHDEAGRDFSSYMTTWRGMVRAAQPELAAYSRASAALAKAPTCSS